MVKRATTKKQFLEIEHKFLLEKKFPYSAYVKKLRQLKPHSEKKLKVTDTYFEFPANKKVVVRHRLDKEQEQLTIKDKSKDNEVRREINIELPKTKKAKHQLDEIKVFLNMLGLNVKGILEKQIHVFYFPKCEIVFYVALERTKKKKVRCMEFEAHGYSSQREALAIIEKYEILLNFKERKRCKDSLYDLLIK